METKHEYRSEALGAIHETMAALENIGAIGKVTMSEFDVACLRPVQGLAPETIRALGILSSTFGISNKGNVVDDGSDYRYQRCTSTMGRHTPTCPGR